MKKLLITLIILVAIVSASSVAFIQYMISPVGGDEEKVYFEIKQVVVLIVPTKFTFYKMNAR